MHISISNYLHCGVPVSNASSCPAAVNKEVIRSSSPLYNGFEDCFCCWASTYISCRSAMLHKAPHIQQAISVHGSALRLQDHQQCVGFLRISGAAEHVLPKQTKRTPVRPSRAAITCTYEVSFFLSPSSHLCSFCWGNYVSPSLAKILVFLSSDDCWD